jgi:hypothetical protein
MFLQDGRWFPSKLPVVDLLLPWSLQTTIRGHLKLCVYSLAHVDQTEEPSNPPLPPGAPLCPSSGPVATPAPQPMGLGEAFEAKLVGISLLIHFDISMLTPGYCLGEHRGQDHGQTFKA